MPGHLRNSWFQASSKAAKRSKTQRGGMPELGSGILVRNLGIEKEIDTEMDGKRNWKTNNRNLEVEKWNAEAGDHVKVAKEPKF